MGREERNRRQKGMGKNDFIFVRLRTVQLSISQLAAERCKRQTRTATQLRNVFSSYPQPLHIFDARSCPPIELLVSRIV